VRVKGQPETAIEFFVVEEGGSARMMLINGVPSVDENGEIIFPGVNEKAVTSAWVSVNGESVFGPSDFNKRVDFLEAEVALEPGENVMEARLTGKPGTFIIFVIFR
jgi:hypothetical protein